MLSCPCLTLALSLVLLPRRFVPSDGGYTISQAGILCPLHRDLQDWDTKPLESIPSQQHKGKVEYLSFRSWEWMSDSSALQMFNEPDAIYIFILLSPLVISFCQAVVMDSRCLCNKWVIVINNKHLIHAALICSSFYWIQIKSSFLLTETKCYTQLCCK